MRNTILHNVLVLNVNIVTDGFMIEITNGKDENGVIIHELLDDMHITISFTMEGDQMLIIEENNDQKVMILMIRNMKIKI